MFNYLKHKYRKTKTRLQQCRHICFFCKWKHICREERKYENGDKEVNIMVNKGDYKGGYVHRHIPTNPCYGILRNTTTKNLNEMYPPMINKDEDMLYPKIVLSTLYGKIGKK